MRSRRSGSAPQFAARWAVNCRRGMLHRAIMKRRPKLNGRPPSATFEQAPSGFIPEERIRSDGRCVVVPLTGSHSGVARLPPHCIKCGTAHDLECWSEMLVSQNRSLNRLFPIVKVHFWICRWHGRIARVWRLSGVAMLLGSFVLFLVRVLGLLDRSSRTQDLIWVSCFSALFVAGMVVGGPWRGPLRLLQVRDKHLWITGTGNAFRSGFEHRPKRMEAGTD